MLSRTRGLAAFMKDFLDLLRLADNFDTDISSQNGKVTTHSLAMLITKPKTALNDDQSTHRKSIKRIQKSNMGKGVK